MAKTVTAHTDGELFGDPISLDLTIHQPDHAQFVAANEVHATVQVDVHAYDSDSTLHVEVATWGLLGSGVPNLLEMVSSLLDTLDVTTAKDEDEADN